MTISRKPGILSTVALALLLLPACTLCQQERVEATGPEVAVIVNPANKIESISQAELRRVFFGEKQSWPGGLAIAAFVRAPGTRERDVLLARVLRISESEYKAHWIKQIYSGESQHEPLVLVSNGMQLEAVRAEKGGIALISAKDLHPGVKVLKVDGHLPGSPEYPLK